jgi:hypothetical protein
LNGELFELLPNTTVMSTPKWFSHWPKVEEKAHTIRTWEPLVIPGLLQTARYARAILSAEPGATEEWIEDAVETRLRRQYVFERENPPMYWALIDECALLRPVGGKEVMREQLEHLLRMGERPTVSFQIVPLEVGATAGLLGGFAIASPKLTASPTTSPSKTPHRAPSPPMRRRCGGSVSDTKRFTSGHIPSLSGSSGGNCLYAAKLSGDRYAIRDSEQPDVPPMILRGGVFRAFVGGAKLGEFDF